MRLHLWDGEASGTITTQTGKILWSAFCERTHNVFVVTVQGSGGEQDATARVREEWGITPCFYLNQKDPETYAAELPPKPEISRLGEINLVTQKMKTDGAHVVASQCVREPGQTRLFVAIGTAAAADVNLAAANAAKDAMSRVQAAVAKGGVALTISHRNWWHAYLQSSYLEIPDDPYWQKYWWRQIYKFGSASSESSDNIIDTQGPWLWDSGYHILTPEQGDQKRELITRSVNRWQDLKGGHAGYTYTGGCAMYATLAEGERALETLDHLKPLIKPNTMYWEGGGEVVETPLSAVESIDYLLLQSWGGVIRIFPAPPQRWKEMTFDNFRTEGAFLVSAAMRNGMVSGVKIHSEAGKTCVLQNPWPGRELTVTDGFGQTVKTMRAGKNFTFATATGGVYFVNPNE